MRTTSRDGPKQLVVPARSVRLWLADLRSMRVEYATWRRQFPQGGFARLQRAQVALEAGAAAVRVFEPSIVPGLLQSPDYTRHVFRGLAQLPGRGRDIDEGVHARMRRQEILYQPGKDFRFLVTEAAMQYLICPRAVLRTQLVRLAVMSALPTVDLAVIPMDAALPHMFWHGFWTSGTPWELGSMSCPATSGW